MDLLVISLVSQDSDTVDTVIMAPADDIRRQMEAGGVITWGNRENDPRPDAEWAVGFWGGHVPAHRVKDVSDIYDLLVGNVIWTLLQLPSRAPKEMIDRLCRLLAAIAREAGRTTFRGDGKNIAINPDGSWYQIR